MQDSQLGWSFCYPGTWRFRERAQSTTEPQGMDLTFDITDVSGSGPNRGEFGYMIIGTYERGSSPSLKDWVASNVGPGVQLSSLTWGNSEQAGDSATTDQWFALTTKHVVEVTMREGDGNLPLSQEMRERLGTWKFSI